MQPTIDPTTYQTITERLGREPRGLASVAAWRNNEPSVIRVHPLVDDKPFPTLYWLIDPEINYALDQLEARGLIRQLQSLIDASPELIESMKQDHLHYINQRNQWMDEPTKTALHARNFYMVLQKRGIGGIENFQRIRCFHTYFAAHLVAPNTVGQLLLDYCATQSPNHLLDLYKSTTLVRS